MTTLKMPPINLWAAGTTAQTQVLNGTDDHSGLAFTAPKTGSITKIHAYFSAVTGTPSITGSIEGITGGATPIPDGTPVTGGATASIVPTAAAWNTFTLGTPASVTVGQQCCAKIKYSADATSATVDRGYSVSGGFYANPYAINLADAVASASNTFLPTICVEYDDGTVVGIAARASSIASGWATGGTPLKGNKWTPAAGVIVDGIYAAIRPAAAFDFMAEIYTAGSGTPVVSAGTYEGDKAFASQSVAQLALFRFAEVTLAANVAHRFVLRATTANAPTEAILLTFKDATTFAGPVGAEWAYTTNDAQDDSWTDTASAICAVFPRVVGVTTTSGGLLRHPGMAGGMNG